ncbi:hypothetical protein [Pseudotabrizicola sp. L79]|uniref:hypothetical protein n=1 Tax=Pseudotabrizicola sp. L79 TaxID=3118402 RepID=UPI002F91F9D8
MDYDLMFVVGLALAALSIPSVLAAYADGRPPWVAIVVLLISAGLLGAALMGQPADLTLSALPDIIFRVIGRVLH